MIDYEYADLFYGSHAKTWIFTCIDPDVQLTFSNDDIVQESISLERGMCETDFFAYGTYSSNSIRVSVFKTEEHFKGKRFLVDVVLDNHTEAPLTVGTFTCESDNLSSDRRSRELVMYDDLYKLSELDVASWYNHFFDTDEPVYMAQFRTSFFEECLHIDYELADSQGTALSADFMEIKKAANYRTLMASTVLKSILVANCVNGMMTNINKFRWVRIKEYDMHLEPPFSHWDIIPDAVLDSSKFYNCNYEEYQVLYVDGMKVTIDPDHAIFVYVPTYDLPEVNNTLDMSYDNMFFRGIEPSEITNMLTDNYNKVHRRISFTPAQIQLRGNLCYEPGDVVQVDIDGKTIYTVIIKQTITGVQGLTMTLSCQGDERFSNPLSVESTSYDDYAGAEEQGGGVIEYVPVTLPLNGWDSISKQQTVSVSQVQADETAQLIQPVPKITSLSDYMSSQILCINQSAGTLTFSYNTAPSDDIDLYVVIQSLQQAISSSSSSTDTEQEEET